MLWPACSHFPPLGIYRGHRHLYGPLLRHGNLGGPLAEFVHQAMSGLHEFETGWSDESDNGDTCQLTYSILLAH